MLWFWRIRKHEKLHEIATLLEEMASELIAFVDKLDAKAEEVRRLAKEIEVLDDMEQR